MHPRTHTSSRLIEASHLLGLIMTRAETTAHPAPLSRADRTAAALLPLCTPLRSGVVLLTGPSGAGKTTLLRSLSRSLRSQQHHLATPSAERVRESSPAALVIDLAPRTPVRRWLSILSAAGLADASVLSRRVRELSQGQLHRLAFALHAARLIAAPLHPAAPPHWLACDEFAALLDRPAAFSLAAGAARLARSCRINLLLATAHEDLADALAPDLLVQTRLAHDPLILTRPAQHRRPA